MEKSHRAKINIESISLPTLSCHPPQDLSLAERSIWELVKDSQFFPPGAAKEDWFHHHSSSRDREESAGSEVSLLNRKCDNENLKPRSQLKTTHVGTLNEHDLRLEKLIGKGGFCEVRLAYLTESDNCYDSNHFISQAGEKTCPTQKKYAIKYLSPTISKTKSKKSFCRGVADLAIESRFLSLLSHPNIIRLHYVSDGNLRENYNCVDNNAEAEVNKGCGHERDQGKEENNHHLHHLGFFLVLEHLHETLDHRIIHTYIPEVTHITGMDPMKYHDDYHQQHRHTFSHNNTHGNVGCHQHHWWFNRLPKWFHHKHDALFVARNEGANSSHRAMHNLLVKRLIILQQIASALKYLHRNHIIFRDIKPDNIGFYNEKGGEVPKLFDFGLVREVKESCKVIPEVSCLGNHTHHDDDAVFKLTGCTGSRRYMSPEVAFCEPYNYKVDVYSFGVLLYEMATLIQPFIGYTVHSHEVEILRQGHRPCLREFHYWPSDLECLIDDCWCGDMNRRPKMDQVMERISACIEEMCPTSSKNANFR